jgi:protein-disulfide isomerase
MSKRQMMRDKRVRQQKIRRFATIGVIAVVAIGIAAALIAVNLPKPVGAIVVPTRPAPPQPSFNSMGDPNAPVKIVEYLDYQCPYCQAFWSNTEAQLIDSYVKTGKVFYTARSLGNFISGNNNQQQGTNNQESMLAAEAAYCAGDQNKFWEYHDILYANQAPENSGALDRTHLDAFAQKIGLDMTTFNSCMDNNKYADRVTQDGVEGTQAITTAPGYDGSGVGTPAFLVNGKLISGNQPFSTFQTAIEADLATPAK